MSALNRRAALIGLVCSALPWAVFAEERELNWVRRLADVLGVSNYRLERNDRVATIITLTARILGPHAMTPPGDTTDIELKRLLRARVAESFANGRLRCVDGWWLPEIEADAVELLECLQA